MLWITLMFERALRFLALGNVGQGSLIVQRFTARAMHLMGVFEHRHPAAVLPVQAQFFAVKTALDTEFLRQTLPFLRSGVEARRVDRSFFPLCQKGER